MGRIGAAVRGILILALLLWAATPALAAGGVAAAAAWLAGQQADDGGFGSVGATADAVVALAVAGGQEAALERALGYLEANLSLEKGGELAKGVLAVVAAGRDPRAFGGKDLVAALKGLQADDGSFGTAVDTAYAVLALAAVEEADAAAKGAAWLRSVQAENGSWSWDGSGVDADGDTNTTALALMALKAAGASAEEAAVQKGLDYLLSVQNEDGGFPYQNPSEYGTETDANSTALVYQALLAWNRTEAAGKAYAALMALQNESGAFAWKASVPDDNLFATLQAIPAAARVILPAVPVATVLPETGGPGRSGLPWLALTLGVGLAGLGAWRLRRRAA